MDDEAVLELIRQDCQAKGWEALTYTKKTSFAFCCSRLLDMWKHKVPLKRKTTGVAGRPTQEEAFGDVQTSQHAI